MTKFVRDSLGETTDGDQVRFVCVAFSEWLELIVGTREETTSHRWA